MALGCLTLDSLFWKFEKFVSPGQNDPIFKLGVLGSILRRKWACLGCVHIPYSEVFNIQMKLHKGFYR